MEPSRYRYAGAQALIELHAAHLSAFVYAWRAARANGVTLPPSDDPSCADLTALLRHVLRAARGYMVWMCEKLELADPGIRPVPDDLEGELDAYVAHLLERWDGPLVELDEGTADRSVFESAWGVAYCIDGMLEHAVMHPIRHRRQLERAARA